MTPRSRAAGLRRVLVVAVVAGVAGIGGPGDAVAAEPAPRPLAAAVTAIGSARAGAEVVRAVDLPWRANLAGISFETDGHAHDVEVAVRARSAGAWTAWETLGVETDHAPDAWEAARASRRSFTDPIWLGAAERVQVRVRGEEALRDVRVHAVNTAGNARPRPLLARAARAVGSFLAATWSPSAARADADQPAIITRSEWGADESIRRRAPGVASSLKVAFVHHTVNSNSYSPSESAAMVRAIYRYHVKSRGYSDIAYNFLVDRYGQVFEGRWGGIDKAVIAAHSAGFNTGSTGVALLGTFSTSVPPSGMIASLQSLLAWKLDVHHVPPVGTTTMVSGGNAKYAAGTRVTLNRISGHRDGQATACPGTETYRRLPAIRAAVDAIGHPKIYLPRLDTTTLRPDGDGVKETTTLRATVTSAAPTWTVSFADSSGTVHHTAAGTGTEIAVTWNGLLLAGEPAPTGRYTWRLEAQDAEGHPARAATGVLYVITRHPSGTPLADATGRYMIERRAQRAMDDVAYRAKFGDLPPVATGPGERGWYTAGEPLGLRRGTLLQGPDTRRYIWTGTALRMFVVRNGIDVFRALDYDSRDLLPADQALLSSMPAGPPVDDVEKPHPQGTVVRNWDTGEKWLIEGSVRRPITTLARASRYRAREVVRVNRHDLALPIGSPYSVRAAAVIADPDGRRPWIVTGGRRRQFVTWLLFERMGFTREMLLRTSRADLAQVRLGPIFG